MTAREPPTAPVRRWTPQRKARIVRALIAGRARAEALIAAHGLSRAELAAWVAAYRAHGIEGLSVTRRPGRAGGAR